MVVLVTGIPYLWHGQFVLGLAGTLSPILAVAGGGGIIGGIREGNRTVPTIAIGLALLALSLFWVWWTGWGLILFGYRVPGIVENLVAFAFGMLFGMSQPTHRITS